MCSNGGQNQVPGQSSPKITAQGSQSLLGSDLLRKNGKSPFNVETLPVTLTWDVAGCPNSNWTAEITSVNWTHATIYVINTSTQVVLLTQNYNCVTTDTNVTCTLAQ
jgi:hypothetical protein